MNLVENNDKGGTCLTYSLPQNTLIIPFPKELLNGPPEGSNKIKIWLNESCK